MRSHLYLPITDGGGHVIPDIEVRLLQPGTVTLIADTVYAAVTGGTVVAQPFVSATGVIDVYCDAPQRVRLGVTPPGQAEFYLEDVDIEPDAGTVMTATAPLRVTNQPTSARKVLQSLDSNTAQWGDEQAADIAVDPTGMLHIMHNLLQPALADLDAAITTGGGGRITPSELERFHLQFSPAGTLLVSAYSQPTNTGSTITQTGTTFSYDETTGWITAGSDIVLAMTARVHWDSTTPGDHTEWAIYDDQTNFTEGDITSVIPAGATTTSVSLDRPTFFLPAGGRVKLALTSFTVSSGAHIRSVDIWIQVVGSSNIGSPGYDPSAVDPVVLGTGATATAAGQVSVGGGAHASGARSVALGAGAQATADDTCVVKNDALELEPSSGGLSTAVIVRDTTGARWKLTVDTTGHVTTTAL